MASDAQGDIWFSDNQDSRITEYVPLFSDGETRSISIGQQSLDAGYDCNGENDTIGRGNDA